MVAPRWPARRLSGGEAAAAVPGGPSSGAARVQDVGQAFEEFLRFAEELQEEMVPGGCWC